MSPPALPRALRDAPDGGVFFLYGADRFQKSEVLDLLVSTYVDSATRDFNLDVLRGAETDVEDLARILATPPMMAEFRVVVLREVEALAGSARARDVLTRLAEAPPPGLVAVLEATLPSGSKAKLYRTLRTKARSAEFAAVDENDVPGWLMVRAREVHGKDLDPEAARALAAAVGTDLGVLARELEKINEMAGERPTITPDVVEAGGTVLPSQDRWKWFDLVGEKRFGPALAGLEVLLTQGESAVGLTIGLATHFLRLGILVESGVRALEQALPRHQTWLARRLAGQARRWTGSEIDQAVLDLRRVDQLLKSSPLPQQHLLEAWLLGLEVRAREAV